MNNKFFYPISSLYIAAVLYLLITGSEILLEPLNHTPYIPLGTFLVWSGLITLSYSVYRHFVKRSQNHPDLYAPIIGKYAGLFSLVMSLMWGFVSYKMAGNWSYNFTGNEPYRTWFIYTRVVAILPFAVILSSLVARAARKMA